MLELVKYIVGQFAENPDDVDYTVTDNGKSVEIIVTLSESDMGKVIGKQGKIAKAMRTILKAISQKENKKYNVEIKERI